MASDALRKCPECGSSELLFDSVSGEIVCRRCGYVVREEMISPRTPEAQAPERIGTERRGISPQTAWRMKNLMRYNARTRPEAKQTLRQANVEIERLSDALHLPASVRGRAVTIYRGALKQNLVFGRSIAGFAAASVYAASREAGIPRTIDELASLSTRDYKEVTRYYRMLARHLKLRMPVDDPFKYIPRITHAVKLTPDTEMLSVNILRAAADRKALAGKDPSGMAAAAVYMACKANKEKCSQREVAEAAGVSEVTLRERMKDLEAVMGPEPDAGKIEASGVQKGV
jgi:transcription initiation factor TFIIB